MKTMKKSLVLAAAIGALSAIAVPSMASAANWGPLNTIHTLNSPSSITFNLTGAGAGFSCSSGPTFTAQVRTPASTLMDLTSTTTNIPCTGTGFFAGCNFAFAMIGLPVWSVDGTSTTNVKINSVSIEGRYTGGGSCSATFGSTPFPVSGTLAGGVWSNLTRSLAFTNGTGLTLGSNPVTVTASEFIKDTTSPFVSLL
jgi:hypothetical protein